MQKAWEALMKRIRAAKKPGNCTSNCQTTKKASCPGRNVGYRYRSRGKGFSIKGWAYRKARTAR